MPATTDATPSVFVIARSAEVVTVSVSVALSFAGVGSVAGDDVTEAVFARVGSAYAGETASVRVVGNRTRNGYGA